MKVLPRPLHDTKYDELSLSLIEFCSSRPGKFVPTTPANKASLWGVHHVWVSVGDVEVDTGPLTLSKRPVKTQRTNLQMVLQAALKCANVAA